MTDRATDSNPAASKRGSIWRYVSVTLTMPLFGATLGLDGGAIFQILAVENLGLSAAAIGTAFGFGVVSVPIQIAAARIPLHRARWNVQLFLLLAAAQAWLLAGLVAADVTGGAAAVALAVTVTAEVAVSVLFATAWQPLLSFGVDAGARQRLNSTWPAIARGVLAGALVVFAALDQSSRAVFLLAVGALAIMAAIGLNGVAPPSQTEDSDTEPSDQSKQLPVGTLFVFVVVGLANLGALPLWFVYLHDVLWPSANLGLIAAVHTVASMGALLAWRPTERDVVQRAVIAAFVILAGAGAVPLLGSPVTTSIEQSVVVAVTVLMTAGATFVRIAMLEQAHRLVTLDNTVRVFTLLDVVASTSLQVGLLVAGVLITAATHTTSWPLDPYEILIITSAIATLAAVKASSQLRQG